MAGSWPATRAAPAPDRSCRAQVQLAHNTKKWAAKHPQGRLARSLPETWPLQLDDVEYIDEALCDVPEVGLLQPARMGC